MSVRHILFIIACCGMAASSMGIPINADGVFYTSVCEITGSGRGAVALYATLQSLATGFAGPPIIRLSKKIPIHKIALFGVIMVAATTVGMAFSKTLWLNYVLAALRGASCTCYQIAVITMVIGNWFHKSNATAVGLVMATTGLAGALFSPLFTILIETFGYIAARTFSAIMIAVLALPGVLFIFRLHPQEKGLSPYGEDKSEKELPTGAPESEGALPANASLFLISTVFISLISAFTALSGHMAGYAESIGYTARVASLLLSCAMIGNITLKLAFGPISDRLGIVRTQGMMLILGMLGTTVFLFPGVPTAILMGAGFLFGAMYAIGGVGDAAMVHWSYGNRRYGEVFSRINVVSNLALAIAQTLFGFVYDFTGSYALVFIFILTFSVLCGGILLELNRRAKAFASAKK